MAFVRDVGPNGGELVNIQMVENATQEVLCGWNTLAQEPTVPPTPNASCWVRGSTGPRILLGPVATLRPGA